MKTLSHIKWIVVILFGCLAVTLISTNCTPSPGTRVDRPNGSDSNGNDRERTRTLTCELPSGNGSCEKDDDCADWCADDLDLTGDAREKCYGLDTETVEQLASDDNDVKSFFGDILKNPDNDELADLSKKDIELICAAVKELGYKILKDRIDSYNAADAKDVLEWVAGTKEAIEIFENAEDDEGLKMIKKLLVVAGDNDSVTDNNILSGLVVDDVKTDGESNENNNVLRIALDENNEGFIDYIHNKIITENKELCGGNTNANRPTTDGACYAASSRAERSAKGFAEEACILGVYCKIAPGTARGTSAEIAKDDEDSEFRQDMANYLDDNSIRKFIRQNEDSGGLNNDARVLTEDDEEDWTKAVCTRLATCWVDSTSLALDL